MNTKKILLLVVLAIVFIQNAYAVKVVKKDGHVNLENNNLIFSYDLAANTYSIFDKNRAITPLSDCYARIGSTNFIDCGK